MIPRVVPAYAGLLGLLYVLLSVRVIRQRGAAKVSLGGGGNAELERRIRVHGNFAEYVPLVLVLLALLEVRDWPPALLHGLCAPLLLGRLAHAWGVSRAGEDFRFRVGGMATTLGVLVVTSLLLLVR